MPWLTARRMSSSGSTGLPRAERQALAEAALRRVGLGDFAEALPRQLSGGMAQRVGDRPGIGRPGPRCCCSTSRSARSTPLPGVLQEHLIEIWRGDRPTMLFVTHDIDEALMLADRVIVLLGRPAASMRSTASICRAAPPHGAGHSSRSSAT